MPLTRSRYRQIRRAYFGKFHKPCIVPGYQERLRGFHHVYGCRMHSDLIELLALFGKLAPDLMCERQSAAMKRGAVP